MPGLPITPTVTTDYNQLKDDISATGTSGQTIESDIKTYQEDVPAGLDSGLDDAVSDISQSLQNGEYSQQVAQGELEFAAKDAGLKNVHAPQINGDSGMRSQREGLYSGNSSAEVGPGGDGLEGAGANILIGEMQGGASKDQILNNSKALLARSEDDGDTNLADAVQNIINSFGDGTYNADASATAVRNAEANN